MEHKRRETQCGEVEHKRRAPALFEENEETDKQVNQADDVDVEISRLPLVKRSEMIEVGPVGASVVRRPLHQVVKLASDASLIEIDLNVARESDFFGPLTVEADSDQTIAG